MSSFEQFREDLRNTLNHLYDPDHRPSDLLCEVTGCSPHAGPGQVQSATIGAIETLRPRASAPRDAYTQRIYSVLNHRFILRLSQEETGTRMGLSVRHLRRLQQEAIHALARYLWERPDSYSADEPPPTSEPPQWSTQLREDLAALHQGSTGPREANVRAAIEAVVALEGNLAAQHGIQLSISPPVDSGLVLRVNSSLLRQALVTVIGHFFEHMTCGDITLEATRNGENTDIVVTGRPATHTESVKAQLLDYLVTSQGGSVQVEQRDDELVFTLSLPSAAQVTVLVVDDNEDLVHFYRRCTRGTRYRIVHAPAPGNLIDTIAVASPDLLVLDIMLPETDGWELLAGIHRDPKTGDLPIIVCSVMREEELALSLGASLYLPKPVQHHEFIRALDEVLRPARRSHLRTQEIPEITD